MSKRLNGGGVVGEELDDRAAKRRKFPIVSEYVLRLKWYSDSTMRYAFVARGGAAAQGIWKPCSEGSGRWAITTRRESEADNRDRTTQILLPKRPPRLQLNMVWNC